jgi:hypothetical protein
MSIDSTPSRTRPNRWLTRGLLTTAVVVGLSLGGAISLSKPFQNGSTRVFSKVVDGVKDHPRWTIVICLGSVAVLWLGLGALAVGQEWRARGTPARSAGADPSR